MMMPQVPEMILAQKQRKRSKTVVTVYSDSNFSIIIREHKFLCYPDNEVV